MSYHQIWNTLYIPPCSDKTNTLYVTSFRPPFISSFLPLLRITIFPFFPGIAYTSFSFLLMCFISLREIHTHTHTHIVELLFPRVDGIISMQIHKGTPRISSPGMNPFLEGKREEVESQTTFLWICRSKPILTATNLRLIVTFDFRH